MVEATETLKSPRGSLIFGFCWIRYHPKFEHNGAQEEQTCQIATEMFSWSDCRPLSVRNLLRIWSKFAFSRANRRYGTRLRDRDRFSQPHGASGSKTVAQMEATVFGDYQGLHAASLQNQAVENVLAIDLGRDKPFFLYTEVSSA